MNLNIMHIKKNQPYNIWKSKSILTSGAPEVAIVYCTVALYFWIGKKKKGKKKKKKENIIHKHRKKERKEYYK